MAEKQSKTPALDVVFAVGALIPDVKTKRKKNPRFAGKS